MEISFVTKNPHKSQEVQAILGDIGVSIVHAPLTIHEIQTEDIKLIVRDKVLKAFSQVGRPVFIEHTGLYIDSLQGFPGGLTQVFWDKLGADKFSELLGGLENTSLTAKTVIAFCDAKKVYIFEGEVLGNIAKEPRGNRDFQWDCVFIPKGFQETFAEMGEKKNEISMRKLAFDRYREFLVSEIL
jgi:XTP/dITP diphosphohydrolase